MKTLPEILWIKNVTGALVPLDDWGPAPELILELEAPATLIGDEI